jgi:hypothetical protein
MRRTKLDLFPHGLPRREIAAAAFFLWWMPSIGVAPEVQEHMDSPSTEPNRPTCPVCGRTVMWRNGIPLRWYCWGTPENEHKEWSMLCSKHPPEPLGELRKKAKASNGVSPVA